MNERKTFRCYIIIFAVVLVTIAGLTSADGAEPDEGRGGFLEGVPPCCVGVKSYELPLGGDGSATYLGTGTWLANDLVISCWHNYSGTFGKKTHKHTIVDHNGFEYDDIEVVLKDHRTDLMLVKVNGNVKPHAGVAVSCRVPCDSHMYAYGFDADGVRFRWTWGQVLKNRRGKRRTSGPDRRTRPWTLTDAFICPGMSGGPSLDADGRLTGINIQHLKGETTTVSLKTIQRFLDLYEVE